MKNIILIPDWVKESLESNNHSIRDVLNQEIVCSTLSNDDVGFYIYINERTLPFKEHFNGLFSYGSNVLGLDEDTLDKYQGFTTRYYLMEGNDELRMNTLLFGNVTDITDLTNLSYEILELDENTIGLLPFIGVDANGMEATIKSLITVLDNYVGFEKLASTSLFKECIKLA